MLGNFFCILLLVVKLASSKTELKLVHVLFLHPPEYSSPDYLSGYETIQNVSDKNFIVKTHILEAMTNKEKLAIYKLGRRLRQRYNNFLGDINTPKISRTRTSDSEISVMSGELVNAGLWPPAKIQQWLTDFLWQPIPIDYLPRNEDTVMMGRLCPTFKEITNAVRKTAEIVELEEKHQALFYFIAEKIGSEKISSRDISYLYKSLMTRASRGLSLPSWSKGIFPNGEMLNVTYLEHDILSKTNLQRILNGGFLIQEILERCAAHAEGSLDKERKMMIYSGDSTLFIGVMHALGVWYPHLPNSASALIFEFSHDADNQMYEIKLFYDLGENNRTIPLKIPGCNASLNSMGCRFENLIVSLLNILPGDDDGLCGNTVLEISFEEEEVAIEIIRSNATRSTYGVFVISIVWILASVF